MADKDILHEISFDEETGIICTRVWSFTEAYAKEKALNRVAFKAQAMGRSYYLLEETTLAKPSPEDPKQGWQCTTKALVI